jgi:hypothetical protein
MARAELWRDPQLEKPESSGVTPLGVRMVVLVWMASILIMD